MPEAQMRICRNMRAAVRRCVKENKLGRKWRSLVGYSPDELMAHLVSKFQPGMTLQNYGKWQIDHIKPISFFRFESFQEIGFKKCWALSNLQPLWAQDNVAKGGTNRVKAWN
jgi:hypothetical protein